MDSNTGIYNNYKLLTISIYLLLTIISVHTTIAQLTPSSNLSLTIYNNNFAIVKDRRQLHFVQGYTMLYFVDVASNIQPETVTFKIVENIQRQSSVNQITIIQQNFDMNVIKSQGVLKYYIGQYIQIYMQQKGQIRNIKGKLLSYGNKFVIQNPQSNTVQSLNNVQGILLPGIPQAFFTKPTLNWKLYSNKTQNAVCQVAYRTTGLKWSSTYNIILYNQQKLIDLGGWVTIDNKSGKRYENARIKLIAGQVNLVKVQTKVNKIKHLAVMAIKESEGGMFVEKTFADYHLYTLNKPITLEQNQIKQIQFIPKVYGVKVQQYYQVNIQAAGQPQTPISEKYIKFLNSQENKLGIPFPAGMVRVFQQDPQGGALQYIGQDSLNHTPKNENIIIYIGKSSAIEAIKKQISRITTNNIGGYSAQLAMKIVNNRQRQAQIVIKFNNIYQDNLKIKMINGQLPIQISASQYQWRKIVQGQDIWEFGWTQNY